MPSLSALFERGVWEGGIEEMPGLGENGRERDWKKGRRKSDRQPYNPENHVRRYISARVFASPNPRFPRPPPSVLLLDAISIPGEGWGGKSKFELDVLEGVDRPE